MQTQSAVLLLSTCTWQSSVIQASTDVHE